MKLNTQHTCTVNCTIF